VLESAHRTGIFGAERYADLLCKTNKKETARNEPESQESSFEGTHS